MKPNRPIHAVTRWTMGLSSVAESLPSFARKETRVKRRKKRAEKARETAMKAGVAVVGAVRRLGASPGRTERSARAVESLAGARA
jgi:phage shock protein A